MRQLLEAYTDVCDAAYALPDDHESQHLAEIFMIQSTRLGLESHDAEQMEKALQMFNVAAARPDKKVAERFIDSAVRYGINHGLTDTAVEGLTQKLLPAMEARDPQVSVLQEPGNIGGMGRGDFGVMEFFCHSYASEMTPPHINELLMVAREIPTSHLAILEQNRRDGLTLARQFRSLRDFIHDQRPGVHDVVSAMAKYYETGEEQRLRDVVGRTDPRYVNNPEMLALLLDRSKYDDVVTESTAHGNTNPQEIKPIDVLRRLSKNTEPVTEESPETSDPEFNQKLQALETNVTRTGRREALQTALDYTNSRLAETMDRGEIGIEPNHILAYGWLEQKAFAELQKLTYEDQMYVYKEPWFHSILQFQELTASSESFDNIRFQEFIAELSTKKNPKDAYAFIFDRTLSTISQLTGKYKDRGKEGWVGALWSGNVAHELIGLTDLRPAETVQGRKHREEQLRPAHERLQGD